MSTIYYDIWFFHFYFNIKFKSQIVIWMESNLFCVNWGSEGVAEEQEVSTILFLIGSKDTVIAGCRNADQALQVFVVFL